MAGFFTFDPGLIGTEISKLMGFFSANIILTLMLFVSYILFYIYSFINNKSADSEVYEMDLVSSGLSSILVVLFLVGLDESSRGFDFSQLNWSSMLIKISIILFVYGIFLILAGFLKFLPRFLVVLFGNSELDLLINLIAILLTEETFAITLMTLLIITAPLLALFIIQRLRRLMPGGI